MQTAILCVAGFGVITSDLLVLYLPENVQVQAHFQLMAAFNPPHFISGLTS